MRVWSLERRKSSSQSPPSPPGTRHTHIIPTFQNIYFSHLVYYQPWVRLRPRIRVYGDPPRRPQSVVVDQATVVGPVNVLRGLQALIWKKSKFKEINLLSFFSWESSRFQLCRLVRLRSPPECGTPRCRGWGREERGRGDWSSGTWRQCAWRPEIFFWKKLLYGKLKRPFPTSILREASCNHQGQVFEGSEPRIYLFCNLDFSGFFRGPPPPLSLARDVKNALFVLKALFFFSLLLLTAFFCNSAIPFSSLPFLLVALLGLISLLDPYFSPRGKKKEDCVSPFPLPSLFLPSSLAWTMMKEPRGASQGKNPHKTKHLYFFCPNAVNFPKF